MKCQNCGAEIGLLNKVCPHCGSANTQSVGHQTQMKHYQKLSGEAKGKVQDSVSRNVPLIVSTVILVLLIIGIGVSLYVAENASLFSHRASRREAMRKHEEYTGILRQYLEKEDYAGFVAFKNLHVIPEYEKPYQEFEKVSDLAGEYCKAMNAIESAVMFGPDSERYGMDSDIFGCRMGIDGFYYEYDKMLPDVQEDPYLECMIDMREKVDKALEIFLGLDEEGRKKYLESSQNQQTAYLEEVLVGE